MPIAPNEWAQHLGTYGPEWIPLVITERNSQLHAMTENMLDYRLTPLNRHVFALPPGLYTDERVLFDPGKDGLTHSVTFANMDLRRAS